MKKRILSILLAVSMVVSLLVVPAGAASSDTTRFSDISDTETAKAVESLRLLGVLDGYGDGTFRPNGQLTRAQFCKMVTYILNGEDQLGLYRTVTVFPDVKPSYWAASYINLAAKGKNIISGYPDGQFHPDRTVTLGQAVTILLRLLGYKDENIGGVWPDSYVGFAASVGLTDGIGTNGNAALTRAQAATLFLNLLRSNTSEGTSYLSTLGTETANVILVSSTATTASGQSNGLQLDNGTVYQIASGKTSSGVLNGCRGTLVLNKQSQALTFIPDDSGSQQAITLLSATNVQITDTTGIKYTVASDTQAYYNGKTTTWGDIYSWLYNGTAMTLYMDATGKVNYVFVGGGGSVSSAVVVYEDGSGTGFDSLTDGAVNYSIYKNGTQATLRDLRKYDVATYDATTNSVRVCDTRVSVYYESCSPNPQAPESIHVLGRDFDVLPTAMDSVAKFKPGQQMTILLTEGGQVAGAVESTASVARSNAVGIVRNGKVQMICGTAQIEIDTGDAAKTDGQLVRIATTSKGTVSLSNLTGGVTGKLNVTAKTLGRKELTDNVMIFRDGEALSLSDLSSAEIPAGQIVYARANWADKIDLIVLSGASNSNVIYGRIVITYKDGEWEWKEGAGPNATKVEGTNGHYEEFDDGSTEWVWNSDAGENEEHKEGINGSTSQIRYISIEYGNGANDKIGPFTSKYNVQAGDYVAVTVDRGDSSRLSSLAVLTELKDVPNSAWTGQSAVTVGGKTYTVPSSVLCYNSQIKEWVSLAQAHSYATVSTLYVYNGVVRAIEVS